MGSEREADFYDQNFAPTMVPLITNPWLPIWLLACQWLEADLPAQLADIGCGAGRFAQLLHERGWKGDYLGLDFSPRTIRAARRMGLPPRYRFEVSDLRTNDVAWRLRDRGTVVALETLEHITADLKLIEELPQHTRIIFSVPNFDSDAHVRHLEPKYAYERYAPLVEYRRIGQVDLSPPAGRLVSMFEGWRR